MQLPHRTGSSSLDLEHDDVVVLTRTTLIDISRTYIGGVAEAFLILLEELSRQYKAVNLHPPHILSTELYIIHLLSDCIAANWDSINAPRSEGVVKNSGNSRSETPLAEVLRNGTQIRSFDHTGPRLPILDRTSRNRARSPAPLDDALVSRILEVLKVFVSPISENYVLPASQLLNGASSGQGVSELSDVASSIGSSSAGIQEDTLTQDIIPDDNEVHMRTIVEFLSASNWDLVLEHVKTTFRVLRSTYSPQVVGNQVTAQLDDDINALANLRLIAFLRVDAQKMGLIISELFGNFLHLRKVFQNTIAVVVPPLVTRWMEQNPEEFVHMHLTHSKIDGGAETLFDMALGLDNVRWRSVLYPFLMSLLFLLPNVWEVASNMRDAKSNSMSKKITFLENLRKVLRNKNATAAYCFTSLLRAARHFDLNGDAPLLSYAFDVQDEVRESFFRRIPPGADAQAYDYRLVAAAIVSLAHLNFEDCNETIAPLCLSSNISQELKLGYVFACCYFAARSNAEDYRTLFSRLSGFIQSYLKVGISPT